jgi:hypothetical protein
MTPLPLARDTSRTFLATPHGAIAGMFTIFGLGVGLWSGTSASVLAGAAVTAPVFGIAMTFFMAAYLTAMSSGGLLGGRFGLRKVLLVGAPLQGITAALLLVEQSSAALFVSLIAFGIFAGLVDLTMNAEGARVEKDLGRPILAGLHGGASCGIALGAIAGSLIAVHVGSWLSALIALAAFAAATAWILGDAGTRRRPGAGGAVGTACTSDPQGIVIGVSIAGEGAATY